MSALVESSPVEVQPAVQAVEVIDDAVVITAGEERIVLDATALIDRLHDTGEQPGIKGDLAVTCRGVARRLEAKPDPDTLRDALRFLQAVGAVPSPSTIVAYSGLSEEQRASRQHALELTLRRCEQRRDGEGIALVRAYMAQLEEAR
jgi:hypothetical protein